MKGVTNGEDLKKIQSYQYVVELSKAGQLYLHAAIHIQRDFKTYLLKIDSTIIQRIISKNIDFSSVEYFDVSKLMKKNRKGSKTISNLIYVFESKDDIPE